MKNLSTVMTDVQKKKKNKKGFSLVELIVVLVIMAILVAALVPSLVGYIRQARQSNSQNEAASVVSAIQTIASSAYADPDSIYHNNSEGCDLELSGTDLVVVSGYTGSGDTTAEAVILSLAEVDGTINSFTITDGVATDLEYKAQNGDVVTYSSGSYSVS